MLNIQSISVVRGKGIVFIEEIHLAIKNS